MGNGHNRILGTSVQSLKWSNNFLLVEISRHRQQNFNLGTRLRVKRLIPDTCTHDLLVHAAVTLWDAVSMCTSVQVYEGAGRRQLRLCEVAKHNFTTCNCTLRVQFGVQVASIHGVISEFVPQCGHPCRTQVARTATGIPQFS